MSGYPPEFSLPRSDILVHVRQWVNAVDQLIQLIGPVAEYHFVTDTNVLIGEIWQLTKKRRKANGRTNLQECIAAGTIIAYVAPAVVDEVEEKLALLAAKGKFSDDEWQSEWANYKALLHIKEPGTTKLARYSHGQDPDDVPSLALADTLSADGVVSNDSDVEAMGGNPVTAEFVSQTRDYSRKAAISVSIRIGGYYVAVGGIISVTELSKALKRGVAWFRNFPDSVQAFALLAVFCVVVHPKSRRKIASWMKTVGNTVPEVFHRAFRLAELAAANRSVPPTLPRCGA